jgi:hypothetical protein
MRRSNVRCRNGDGPVIERSFSTKIELALISLPWPNGFKLAAGRDEPLGQRLNGRQGKVAERVGLLAAGDLRASNPEGSSTHPASPK